MCAVSDAGHLAVLLAGLVQALVTVDMDQGQLLHAHREGRSGDTNHFHWIILVHGSMLRNMSVYKLPSCFLMMLRHTVSGNVW